jgi:DNA (cytosine-5)-methyltransferase 1
VRNVGRANLVPVDVICGGFPCQDISLAGRQVGIVAGTRSGLWFEFSRIVRELRPRYVVVENVAALLTLGIDAVLGELAASGYDAEWDCVPASSVGAPHRRDRVFLVAHARRSGGTSRTAKGGEHGERAPSIHTQRRSALVANSDRTGLEGRDRGILQERTGEWTARTSSPSADVPDTDNEGQPGRAINDGAGLGMQKPSRGYAWWEFEPDVGRVAHGVPARVDRLRALGNSVVPQVAEVVGQVVLALESQREVA